MQHITLQVISLYDVSCFTTKHDPMLLIWTEPLNLTGHVLKMSPQHQSSVQGGLSALGMHVIVRAQRPFVSREVFFIISAA